MTRICVLGCDLKSEATSKADEDPLKPDICKFGSSELAHFSSALTCG